MCKIYGTRFILLLLVATAAVTANAIPITWALQDAIFEDGGTASGTFTVDVDNETIFDISITTTSGSDPALFPGATFTGDTISALFTDDGLVGFSMTMTDGLVTQSFGLAFITALGVVSPLDNLGGSALLYEGESFEEICGVGPVDCAVRFMEVGGQVISVPEPYSLSLLLLGMLGFGITISQNKKRGLGSNVSNS